MMRKLGVLFLCILFFLTGCVTTTTNVNSKKLDLDTVEGATKSAKQHIVLGLRYLQNGNYPKAKKNLDRAIEVAPQLAEGYYSLGYYYQTVQESELAEQQYKKAISKDAQSGEALNIYGAFLCHEKRYDEADDYFQKAVAVKSYSKIGDTYENAAICAEEGQKRELAMEYYRKALNYNPKLFTAVKKIVVYQLKKQAYDEARQTLREHEDVASISADSLALRVDIEKAAGNYAQAKRFLDFLQQRYPDYDYSTTNY